MTNEQIIEELGYEGADASLQQTMVDNTRHIVEMRVIATVTELMSDEQSDEFAKLTETTGSQEIWDWLKTNIVGADVSEVYEAALKDYIESFRERQSRTA